MGEEKDLLSTLLLELRRGTLTISVLSQMNEPKYGYALVQSLEEKGVAIDPNTLYPLLRRLESQQLLESKETFAYPVQWGMDLATEHERYLCEKIYQAPVFIVNYPKDIKAFYMRQNADGRTVAACDLLVPGVGELVGGSQREERYDVLKERMEALGMDLEAYQWYLDLRRFGGVQHAGFGLGFERFLMYLTGVKNIRDVIPYPRTPRQLQF